MPRPRKIVAEPAKVKKPPQVRLKPEDRKAQLLQAGYALASKSGIKSASRIAVAAAVGATDGLINRYFEGKKGMHDEILEYASKVKKDAIVIAHAHTLGYELPQMTHALAAQVKAAIRTYGTPAPKTRKRATA